ncbi:MAG: SDR family NAD(P)-dependent oxidoreductase [Spirochaetaceae bacterium]|jgi:NAD(P)-dependent dehydrogenase (short-subunit alcohol dehydrogenase family)|nr:SDR family NAD(P)-dependent oxidoreductase [Spirochaetaceae bacterium]
MKGGKNHAAPCVPGAHGAADADPDARTARRGLFSGKKALVVGGSGGIGGALSRELGRAGAEVWVHGASSRERLEKTLAAIRGEGGRAEGFLCAIHDPEAGARALLERVPDPDILVIAWGPFRQGPLERMSAEDWIFLTNFNIILPGILISSVLCGMIEKRWGRILLFGGTDTAAVRGFSTTPVYSAAKTALGVVARSAARRGGPFGVSCNVLCPGLTDTEYSGEEAKAYNKAHYPGVPGPGPGEIARAGVALMTHPGLNGAVIPIDGGVIL